MRFNSPVRLTENSYCHKLMLSVRWAKPSSRAAAKQSESLRMMAVRCEVRILFQLVLPRAKHHRVSSLELLAGAATSLASLEREDTFLPNNRGSDMCW